LPPGNYTVGIDDPALLNGVGASPAPSPNAPAQGAGQGGTVNPAATGSQPTAPTPVAPRQGGVPPSGQQSPTGAGSPQSRLQSPATPRATTPRHVLAQVADDSTAGRDVPPTGQTQPLDTPPTGSINELDAPATGEVNELDATPTGQSRVDPRDGANAGGAGQGAANPAVPIGTLTVDQNGTGRLQQVVEAARVQDIVGLAIVIYSQGGETQAAQHGNLNSAEGAALRQPEGARTGNTGVSPTGNRGAGQQAGAASGREDASGMNEGRPVAGGTIRLMSERNPGEAGGAAGVEGVQSQAAGASGGTTAVPQSNASPAAQQPIR